MDQLIFTVSTGRSGTGKLWELMSSVPTVFAEHGGEPYDFHQARLWDKDAKDKFVENKIAQYHAVDRSTVIHTGHAASGFIEHFVERGIIPNLVILRRDPRLVAASLFDLNWVPGRNETVRKYFPGPDESNTLPLSNWNKMHNYQLCFWWCCEVENRIKHYEQYLSTLGSKIWYTSIDLMIDLEHFNRMLTYFSLPNVLNISKDKFNELGSIKIQKSIHMSSELLSRLELEVLDSLPSSFKQHLLSLGWADGRQ